MQRYFGSVILGFLPGTRPEIGHQDALALAQEARLTEAERAKAQVLRKMIAGTF